MDERQLLRLRQAAHGLGGEFGVVWSAYTDAYNNHEAADAQVEAARCREVGARYDAALDELLAHLNRIGEAGGEEAERVRRLKAVLARELDIIGPA